MLSSSRFDGKRKFARCDANFSPLSPAADTLARCTSAQLTDAQDGYMECALHVRRA